VICGFLLGGQGFGGTPLVELPSFFRGRRWFFRRCAERILALFFCLEAIIRLQDGPLYSRCALPGRGRRAVKALFWGLFLEKMWVGV